MSLSLMSPYFHVFSPSRGDRLSVKASGVAGEAAVPAYDAVAGDDEGDGISSDGASDGAGG